MKFAWITLRNRSGRARRISLTASFELVLGSQRSLNLSQDGRLEVTLNRLKPYMFGGYLRTRQRPPATPSMTSW